MGAHQAKFWRKRPRLPTCAAEQDAIDLRKAFKSYFGSETIAKSKFVAMYVKNHADDAKNPILKHLVRVLERKDGTISFEDFYLASRTVEAGDKDSQLAWLFSFHDLDGDGQIDKFEMLEIVKTAYGIISRKDKDGSVAANDCKQQTMSPEERLRSTFCTAIDQNSDGVLTRDEFINAYTLNSDVCCIIIKGIADLLHEIKSELLAATRSSANSNSNANPNPNPNANAPDKIKPSSGTKSRNGK